MPQEGEYCDGKPREHEALALNDGCVCRDNERIVRQKC